MPARPIPWHRRLEARVLVTVTIIVGVLLAGVLAATERVLTRYSLDRSSQDLMAARTAFDRLVEARTLAAARQTRLVAELPVFRATLTNTAVAADPATVNYMAAEYCLKLGADFCVVTDAAGGWIGRDGDAVVHGPLSRLQPIVAAARSGAGSSDILTLGHDLYLVVAEPALFGQELLGTLTVGYRLDDEVARELALITHCQVTFVCEGVCGSSLPAQARGGVAALVTATDRGAGLVEATPALRTIADVPYVSGTYALGTGANRGWIVLLRDWSPTEQALAENSQALARLGTLAFGISLAGMFIFSRRLAKPLRDLAGVAGEVANGRWTGLVPVSGPDEARTMATAFNAMTAALGHWHEQVEARTEALRSASDRFRAVTDSASDAIVSIDARGHAVFWSLRAEAVFGYREQEVLGRPLHELVPERLRAEFDGALARILAGDRSAFGRTVEVAGLHRDGVEVPIELSLSTWREGTETFYTGVVRDITERRQAAEALRESEEQLRQAQKMEAVGRLAGGVAHDFNNLLTAILGYADLLLDRLPPDDRSRPAVIEIHKAGQHAASLTRNLLAFSRKQVLEPIVLNLNDVIETTESLLARLVGEDVEITLDLDPALHLVRADPGQVGQVLLNLAVNARDAMPGGGQLIMTSYNADALELPRPVAPGPHVVLSVQDTGCGMTEPVLAHIFEPFFTTKGVGAGTGLGLATVYGIVEQSGGKIWADSTPGVGTTFTVCLPAAMANEIGRTDGDRGSIRTGGSETILLVEDNDAVRALAREALTGDGYVVVEATNGREALSAIEGRLDRIALVVTDVVMPVMGGRELVDRLRAARPDINVVFMSGYASDPHTPQHARDSGAGFLQKPFAPATLRRSVRELLDAAKDAGCAEPA